MATKKSNPSKKPSVTVANGKNTAEVSAKLSRVRRSKDDKIPSGKATIASRTAFRRQHRGTILACFAMAFLVLLAFFFEFCVQGYSFSALVCLFLTAVIGFYAFVPKLKTRYPKFTRSVIRIFSVILCIGLLVFCATEALVIQASFGNPEAECGYLLVLGAKVRTDGPSLSLQNRIDAAYDYLTDHPDTIAVVSGGQGPDEPITEAQCMFDNLTAMGIDPSRIWLEEKSTSTWENLLYSLDLIEAKTGQRPDTLAVLSSEYHLFRVKLFTEAAGAEFIGIPAKTTNPVLKVNYFLREVAGVWHYILLGSLGGHYHA